MKKNTSEINFIDQNNIIGTLKTQGRKNIFKPDNDIKENYWFSLNREDILKFTGKKFSKYIIYLDGNYQFPRPKKLLLIFQIIIKIRNDMVFISDFNSFAIFIF